MQTVKKSLKSTVNEPGTKLSRFLMSYRTTPHTTTEETPAELFLKQSIQTRLDLLKPNLEDKITKSKKAKRGFMIVLPLLLESFYLDKTC